MKAPHSVRAGGVGRVVVGRVVVVSDRVMCTPLGGYASETALQSIAVDYSRGWVSVEAVCRIMR